VGAVAFLAYVIGEFNLIPVYGSVLPAVALAVGLAIPPLGFALVVLGSRNIAKRLPVGASLAVFPALFSTWELALSCVSPHGTAGSVAYSQVPFVPLIQIARLGGISSITFLLWLIPSGIALALRNRRKALWLAGLPLCALLASLACGY
jgi:apolipoprotein N-acyltransferase